MSTTQAKPSIHMRAPKVRDIVSVENVKSDVEREIALICNLCELPKDDVMDMPYADYKTLQKQLASFLA